MGPAQERLTSVELKRVAELNKKTAPVEFLHVDPYSGGESVVVQDTGKTVFVRADHQKVGSPVHAEANGTVNAFKVAKGAMENGQY